ncbi:hypothetical protein OO009_04780 [Flavobacteriaceae bacterium KMM 6897]|nr:hypothetical protein [Flavobacteriaceae bacterium KMM 6897]
MRYILPGLLKQTFMLSAILAICGLVLWQMIPYLSGMLGALILYVLMGNCMAKLVERGWNRTLAALSLIFLSFIAIFLPLIAIIFMLGGEIGNLADKIKLIERENPEWKDLNDG